MNLKLEQIQELTHGANSVTKEGDVVRFTRFTQSQIEAFAARNSTYQTRCQATAGIRVEFETNSRHLRVDTKAAGRYELLVDGMQVCMKTCEAVDCLYTELTPGNHYVTVMLPWHTNGALGLIMLDEGAYVKPHSFDHKFLFLGDSITQGSTSRQDSLAYVSRVARWFNADYINWGVGGTKFFPETLEKPDFEPDTVFIAYGTNDFNSMPSLQEIEDNCRQYLSTIKSWYPDARVFVISPLWRLDCEIVRAAGTLDEVRQAIIRQVQAHGFTHIDGYKLTPHDPKYYDDKRLHPDVVGMSIYAEQLIRQLVQTHGYR